MAKQPQPTSPTVVQLDRELQKFDRARVRALTILERIVRDTLENGAPIRLKSTPLHLPAVAKEQEEYNYALDVIDAWRRIERASSLGLDTSSLETDMPSKEEALSAHKRLHPIIQSERARVYYHRQAAEARKRARNKSKDEAARLAAEAQEDQPLADPKPKPEPKPEPKAEPKPKPKPAPKPKPVVINETASTTLVAYAPDAPIDGVSDIALLVMIRASTGTRRDELWREAKRRGWTRRQMIEAFE